MDLLVAWKKVLLFGVFGAVGCLAGWLVGEPYLFVEKAVMQAAGAREAPSLISTPPSTKPPPPPAEFLERLKTAGAKSGDVQISLIWNDTNDLDLHCVDPSGFEISYRQKFSPTGGHLDVDRNAGCRLLTLEPVENIYWPENRAPLGEYHVYVNFYQRCGGGKSEPQWNLNVLHGGRREERTDTIVKEPGPSDGPKKHVYKFTVAPSIELFVPQEVPIPRGTSVKVPVALRRAHFNRAVDVTAENLPANVTADTLTLQPGQSEGELTLKATDDAVSGKTKIKFVATGDGVTDSEDAELVVPSSPFSLVAVVSTGIWTALLAVGLCLALVAGQNRYLGKPLFASGRVPLVAVILGAVAAGFVSGSVGQALFFVFLAVGVSKLGLVLGWMLLGVLLGAGVSFFVPNLDAKKSALAGLAGGFLGGVTFWIMSYAADVTGRFGGAALLGFCIGLMVAVVEAAFRRAWLEVKFSAREVITVNLGPEPVKVGGDARACTVWARGAADVALRYFVRDGKVICTDVPARQEEVVQDGDTRTLGSVTVVVRTGADQGGKACPVPRGAQGPRSAEQRGDGTEPRAPAPPPVPAPAQSKPAEPDWDDGLPMPMSPPPPARPAARSILDTDDSPQAPRAAAPVAAKPVPPPKPAAPPAPKPPAPKPPAPASASKVGDPDACPSCGRKSPGRPGARYCMVCDRTF